MNAPKILWYDDEECSAGPTKFHPHEVKYVSADLVDGLVEALSTAKDVFRVYQAHHEAKGDMTKAEANGAYAKAIEDALKTMEEE